jgi:hypothetical protein
MNHTCENYFSRYAVLRLRKPTAYRVTPEDLPARHKRQDWTRWAAYGTQAHARFERIPASLLSLPKEFVEQLFTAYLEKRSHIGEDCRERANTKRLCWGTVR